MSIRNKKPNRNGLVKSNYSKLKSENEKLKLRIEELEKQLSIHVVVESWPSDGNIENENFTIGDYDDESDKK